MNRLKKNLICTSLIRTHALAHKVDENKTDILDLHKFFEAQFLDPDCHQAIKFVEKLN